MNNAKHTPGRWTASVGSRGAHINVANDYNHPLSFGFKWSDTPGNEALVVEAQANAALIAAAPELLAALERAASVLRAISDLAASYPRPSNDLHGRTLLDLCEIPKHAAIEASAALAKARGE